MAVMRKSIYSRRQEALCEYLQEVRKTAGLTQAALAKRLRRPQSFVAKYEQGQRRLDIIELITVLEVLNANLATLVERVKSA
jgi:transcriptional regulator with XRE-family HTH domain